MAGNGDVMHILAILPLLCKSQCFKDNPTAHQELTYNCGKLL
jgi:hypothetical protein